MEQEDKAESLEKSLRKNAAQDSMPTYDASEGKRMPLDKAKQIMNNSNATKDKPNTLNNESKNEVSQTKINEIKKKSEIAIKNQKKSKDKTKERSNQNPSLGKNL